MVLPNKPPWGIMGVKNMLYLIKAANRRGVDNRVKYLLVRDDYESVVPGRIGGE